MGNLTVAGVESLHADAGWRNFDFLKITTDERTGRLERVQRELRRARRLRGDRRPRAGAHRQGPARLRGARRPAVRAAPAGLGRGGPAGHRRDRERAARRQGARRSAFPSTSCFGGPVRDRIRLYWSHCGTYRVSRADGDGDAAGAHPATTSSPWARRSSPSGYTALKTNVLLLGDDPARATSPASPAATGFPELNADRYVRRRRPRAAGRLPRGRRARAWTSWSTSTSTTRPRASSRMARAMEPFDLFWVEIDTRDPEGAALHPQPDDDPGRLLRVPLRPRATTGPSSSTSRWTWPSSTRRGTAWRSR